MREAEEKLAHAPEPVEKPANPLVMGAVAASTSLVLLLGMRFLPKSALSSIIPDA